MFAGPVHPFGASLVPSTGLKPGMRVQASSLPQPLAVEAVRQTAFLSLKSGAVSTRVTVTWQRGGRRTYTDGMAFMVED